MNKKDKRNLYFDIESTDCAIGLVATYLDEKTSGITLLRGEHQAIMDYVQEQAGGENTAVALCFAEVIPDVHLSPSAMLMAGLVKLLVTIIEQGENNESENKINDLLKQAGITLNQK